MNSDERYGIEQRTFYTYTKSTDSGTMGVRARSMLLIATDMISYCVISSFHLNCQLMSYGESKDQTKYVTMTEALTPAITEIALVLITSSSEM